MTNQADPVASHATNTAPQPPQYQEPQFKTDNEIDLLAIGVLRQNCVDLTLTDVHRVLKQAGVFANQLCTLMPSPMFDAYAQLVQGSCSAPQAPAQAMPFHSSSSSPNS